MKKITRTTPEWVELAKSKHGDKYDYSAVVYQGTHVRVNITCPVHGQFSQLAYKHLAGLGCNSCGRISVGDKQRKTIESLIVQARSVHGDTYDYSLITTYVRPNQKLPIICSLHGEFLQRSQDHLQGSGCPKCSHRTSRPEQQWLDSLGVSRENRQIWIRLDGAKFHVDAYDPRTNTIYEFWGDYWHGNPQVYASDDINATNGILFGELYKRTVDKKNKLIDNGYTVIEMWEQEWKLTNCSLDRGK